jgi:hypothetical protein
MPAGAGVRRAGRPGPTGERGELFLLASRGAQPRRAMARHFVGAVECGGK